MGWFWGGSCFVCVTFINMVPLMISFWPTLLLTWYVFRSCTGASATEASEMVAHCLSQYICLIKDLGPAMQRITKLTLAVTHHDCNAAPHPENVPPSKQQQQLMLQHPEQLTVCPPTHASVPTAVFGLLAMAVPNLQELHLCGCCPDPALKAFGASCPRLVSLHVHAPNVPVTALTHLAQHLPNLASITIWSSDITKADEQQLGVYMESFLKHIESCPKLTALHINFPEEMQLLNKAETWACLPESLLHLRCTCKQPTSEVFDDQLQALQSVDMDKSPGYVDDLLTLFQAFLPMRNVKANGTGIMLFCDQDDITSGRSLLKQRFLDEAFQLECWHLNLEGTCAQVSEVLAWLPPLKLIKRVCLLLDSTTISDCLQHLARVFPILETLWVGRNDGRAASAGWGLDNSVFEPLTACTQLALLEVHGPFTVTLSGFTQLCSSLPAHTELLFYPCEDDDQAQFEAELFKFRPEAELELDGKGRYSVVDMGPMPKA